MRVPWYLMAKGKGGVGYKTVSGPIVSVNDALAAPLRSLLVNIEPVQDLHGYDSPWPAGGGKNLLNDSLKSKGDGESHNVYFGGATATTEKSITLPAGTYTFTCKYKNLNGVNLYAINIQTSAYITGFPHYGRATLNIASQSFTLTEETQICFYTYHPDITSANEVDFAIVESGSSFTSYAPYSNICPISGWSECKVWVKPTYDPTANPTATLQLGQTVYGGTLDVTTGVLTVDRTMVDLGTLAFVFSPSANRASVSIADVRQKTSWNTHIGLCSCYSEGNISNNSGDAVGFGFYNTTLFIRDPRFTSDITTAQIQSLLSGQKIIYELATPITIPLTATEIATLQGQNNVWADSGDIAIEYLASGGVDPDLMKLAVAFMGRK